MFKMYYKYLLKIVTEWVQRQMLWNEMKVSFFKKYI